AGRRRHAEHERPQPSGDRAQGSGRKDVHRTMVPEGPSAHHEAAVKLSGSAGKRTVKTDPPPALGAALTVPPWTRAMLRTIASPRPVPSMERACEGSPRKNRSNSRWAFAGSI